MAFPARAGFLMKNIKDILVDWTDNKTLMVVYPHPDDETMAAGGLLIVAKEAGFKTVAVILTKGDAGRVHTDLKGKTLAEVRTAELERAVKILNLDTLILGEFLDGKLRETEKEWVNWVEKQIEKVKPGIVVTYDHSGMSGHPDHIILSLELEKLLRDMYSNKNRPLLLWNTLVGVKRKFVNKLVVENAVLPEYELRMDPVSSIKKWQAAREHVSQKLGKGLPVPLFLVFLLLNTEWYHQVDWEKDYPFKFVPFKI